MIYTHVAVGVVCAALAAAGTWQVQNWRWGTKLSVLKDSHAEVLKQLEVAKKNDEAWQTERRLNKELSASDSKLQEANRALNEKTLALDRAIRAGRVCLPSPNCTQATASAAPAAVNLEAACKSDRQVDSTTDAGRTSLLAISQIVADGDRAINQLNACVDAYNAVRDQINGSGH
jgi:flagellar capping protein FliD